MDGWGATAALAAVAWLNGVHRVPQGALVLRRALLQRWAAVDLDVRRSRWHVVGWWPPFTASVVLAPAPHDVATAASARRASKRLDGRLRRARPWLRALRGLAAAELSALVLGVPWAAARFGVWGLGLSCAAVLLLAAVTAVVAAPAFRSDGATWGSALRAALPLLSPFGAPRAADSLFERVVAGTPPLLVARALLPPEAFAALIRPRAYDAQRDGGVAARRGADRRAAPDESPPSLTALLGAELIASVVETPPPGCVAGERYCPRCAMVYEERVEACGECEQVPLVRPARARAL